MPFRQLIPVYLFTLPTVSLRKLNDHLKLSVDHSAL